MFEFDAGKLIIIGIVALVVIGPKELPRVMRQAGQAMARLRRLGSEFQAQFVEAMREADAEDIRADMTRLAQSAKANFGFDNPLAQMRSELTSAIDGAGTTARLPSVEVASHVPSVDVLPSVEVASHVPSVEILPSVEVAPPTPHAAEHADDSGSVAANSGTDAGAADAPPIVVHD